MKNSYLFLCLCLFASLLLSSCAHPMLEAKEYTATTVSKTFKTDANGAYAAVRSVLKTNGYAITAEDLQNGIVTSGWRASTADSHYVAPFGHRDYGVNGAYFKLEIRLIPDGSSTRVEIASKVKSIVAHLKSSEIEEKKILSKVGDYLRGPDIRLTNIGIDE